MCQKLYLTINQTDCNPAQTYLGKLTQDLEMHTPSCSWDSFRLVLRYLVDEAERAYQEGPHRSLEVGNK